MRFFINTKEHEITDTATAPVLSYEHVIIYGRQEIPSLSLQATMVVKLPDLNGFSRTKCLLPGQSITLEEGTHFTVVDTGNA